MSFPHAERMNTLIGMLSFCRPAGAKAERRFIKEFIAPLDMQTDAAGNLYKRIGKAPVLWSCHTDTVHRQGGKQHLAIDHGVAKLALDSKASCLGADDTAGVWLMREMILAKREGLYVFHRGEEIGGIGSTHIAQETPELLDGIQAAIAFDRKGRHSVITHQWGGRCASESFANSLAWHLGGDFMPDDTGTFTDTANYVYLVPECTNVSVGYENCHTAKETLDLKFILRLRESLLDLNWKHLTIERDNLAPDEDEGDWYQDLKGQWRKPSVFGHLTQDNAPRSNNNLLHLVQDYPSEVADLLEAFGMDGDSLADELYQRGALLSV
jgi:hypothetical protein